MNYRLVSVITGALILFGIYACYFSDWFNRKNIQIVTQIRPMTRRGGDPAAAFPVAFALNRKYELTKIKVTPETALKTNKHAAPVWQLITDSNSIPVKAFSYGVEVPGMRMTSSNAVPAPLKPNEVYRVYVEADGIIGETNFVAMGPGSPANLDSAPPIPASAQTAPVTISR